MDMKSAVTHFASSEGITDIHADVGADMVKA